MKNILVTIIISFNALILFSQSDSDFYIQFYTNKSVKNAEEDYAIAIIDLWKSYLTEGTFVSPQSEYWDHEMYVVPDQSYVTLIIDLLAAKRTNKKVQNSIIGITPVENDHYMLKTMFTSVTDSTDQVNLHYIITVFAKKVGEDYKFVNSTQYHKEIWENKQVGSINYIIHPEHPFDLAQAEKMNGYNKELAAYYGIAPIPFDYVVCNDTDQLSQLMGYDFFEFSYQPVRSGGMADTHNTILYAGNNSEHYPHELVHLYNHHRVPSRKHHWVDEGIAAYFGGSTGYTLDWHLQKLRAYLLATPDFKIESLADMQKNIPNGEYMTDFRYVIGGLIARKIYEEEGMQGLFDALESGRTDENYFTLIEEKLGVSEEGFADYIKEEVLAIPEVTKEQLSSAIYKTK